MGISNCSGPCELCVNHGHCSAHSSDNDFQLDMDKWKPILENWWNINVAETLKRGLRLDQEADESKEEKERD